MPILKFMRRRPLLSTLGMVILVPILGGAALYLYVAASFLIGSYEEGIDPLGPTGGLAGMGKIVADFSPQWTPDGGTIVLSIQGDIYSVEADGSILRRIHKRTATAGGYAGFDVAYSPDISPDGTRVAYAALALTEDRSSGAWEIFTSALDGSEKRSLTRMEGVDEDERYHSFNPVWTPNGRIAFATSRNWNENGIIKSIQPDGSGEIEEVPSHYDGWKLEPFRSAWSPYGGKLAFISDKPDGYNVLYAAKTGGEGLIPLAKKSYPNPPAWSPDGSRVAFINMSERLPNGHRPVALYTVSPDGSDLFKVVESSPRNQMSHFLGSSDSYILNVSWSPDGLKLLVSGQRAVSVVNADGSDFRTLVELRTAGMRLHASWSPSGDRIAVYNEAKSGIALFTMAQDGSDKRLLLDLHDGNLEINTQPWDASWETTASASQP